VNLQGKWFAKQNFRISVFANKQLVAHSQASIICNFELHSFAIGKPDFLDSCQVVRRECAASDCVHCVLLAYSANLHMLNDLA